MNFIPKQKRANKKIELPQIVRTAQAEGEPAFEFIEKKRSEGKCGKESMVAGMNKFLRIYYGKVAELYRNLGL